MAMPRRVYRRSTEYSDRAELVVELILLEFFRVVHEHSIGDEMRSDGHLNGSFFILRELNSS